MISCPVCDWEPDETADSPRSSVIAHMTSSKGEHEGIGYQKADAMLDANDAVSGESTETDSGDDDPDVEADDPPADDEADDGLGLSGGDPFDQAEADSEPDPTVDDDDDTATADSSGWGALAVLGALAVGVLALTGRNRSQTDTEDDEIELV